MTTKDFYIGKEKVPSHWGMAVMTRAFDEKALKGLWETYKNARLTAGGAYKEPTELQKKIAAYAKKTRHKHTAIAAEFKVKYHVVKAALEKVAVWEYLNK